MRDLVILRITQNYFFSHLDELSPHSAPPLAETSEVEFVAWLTTLSDWQLLECLDSQSCQRYR